MGDSLERIWGPGLSLEFIMAQFQNAFHLPHVLPSSNGLYLVQKLVTLPETNSSSLQMGHPKRTFIFQPSIFRGDLFVPGSVYMLSNHIPRRFLIYVREVCVCGDMPWEVKVEHLLIKSFCEL